jgi:hypothetical protein
MLAGLEWFSPTRMSGMAAYGASCMACTTGWVSCLKSRRPDRLFALLAAVQFFLLLDMVFDWRWKIHDFFGLDAMNLGVYGERRPPQAVALLVIFAVLVIAAIWIYRRFRGRPALAMAVIGTVLSFGVTCCEAISYHYVDMVLYHKVGSVMVVSLIWVGLGLFTCCGVLLDWKNQKN